MSYLSGISCQGASNALVLVCDGDVAVVIGELESADRPTHVSPDTCVLCASRPLGISLQGCQGGKSEHACEAKGSRFAVVLMLRVLCTCAGGLHGSHVRGGDEQPAGDV